MKPSETVPNVPCGVERWQACELCGIGQTVPNVPCGVESIVKPLINIVKASPFLMYRVELKVGRIIQVKK